MKIRVLILILFSILKIDTNFAQIKSIIEKEFYISSRNNESNWENKSVRSITKMLFDKAGRMTDSINIDTANNVLSFAKFDYDKNSNLIDIKIYVNQDSIRSHYQMKYDKKNRIISYAMYKQNRLIFKDIYTYNNNKATISNESSFWGGLNDSKTIEIYDNKNQKIEKIEYSPNGNIYKKTLYKYKKGKLIKLEKYSSENKLVHTEEYQYDDFSNIIKDNRGSFYEYKYNEKNDWIEKTRYIGTQITQFIERQIIYY